MASVRTTGGVTEVAALTRALDGALPELARDVIRSRLDLADPDNRAFLADPDDRNQHQTHWHQWGIITHTRLFLRHFDDDLPRYLQEWGLEEHVDAVLQMPIDGVPRRALLRIAILLHDLGKFGARTRGTTGFHFARHEELSGQIIRSQVGLTERGLTVAQAEYVARTAEDHFVLGHIRKRARDRGDFDRTFIAGRRFAAMATEIAAAHPDDYVEIGILFLGDSLAKTDPVSGPERAVDQYDVNVAAARRYLEVVLNREGSC